MKNHFTRTAAVFVGCAAAGIVALAVQYALRPTPLPASGEYFLTELARGQIGPISVLFALGAALAFGYYLQAQPALIGFSMVAVFPIIAMYEGTRFKGSHNLLPFEMAFVATWAVPLILGAWAGRWLARRSSGGDVRTGGAYT